MPVQPQYNTESAICDTSCHNQIAQEQKPRPARVPVIIEPEPLPADIWQRLIRIYELAIRLADEDAA